MREQEKNKFLNIVSEKERYALAQDKAAPTTVDVKSDVKPIVFNNIDAATGKSVELKDTTSLTPMEMEKKKEQDTLNLLNNTSAKPAHLKDDTPLDHKKEHDTQKILTKQE